MSIFSSIGKALGKLNPLSLIGDAIGGVTSLISNNQSNKYASHMTDKQIAAQKEMNQFNVDAQKDINAANIASQEKINQQQIDFQRDINSIMRHDSKHAISDKRADLMRAGYSTADPSNTGFSAASLGSPSLTAPQAIAPQVASEFTPEMAANSILAKNSVIGNAAQIAQTMADIALKRAQSGKTRAELEGITKSNAWIDLMNNATYANILEHTETLHQQGKVSSKQAEVLTNELTAFDTNFKILKEQLFEAQQRNKVLPDMLREQLNEVVARVANINVNTDVKSVEKDILGIRKDFDQLKYDLAKLGVNFDSNDLFSSMVRLFTAKNAKALIPTVANGIKEMFSSLLELGDSVGSDIDLPEVLDNLTPAGTIKRAVKFVSGRSKK